MTSEPDAARRRSPAGRTGRSARTGFEGTSSSTPRRDFAEDRFKVGQILLVGPEDRAEACEIRDVRFHQGRPIVVLDGHRDDERRRERWPERELWLPQSVMRPAAGGDVLPARPDWLRGARHARRGDRPGDGGRGHDRPQPPRDRRQRADPAGRAHLRRDRRAGPRVTVIRRKGCSSCTDGEAGEREL